MPFLHRFQILLSLYVSNSSQSPANEQLPLNYLYEKYPDNLMIIDKLSSVLLKALNKDAAMDWLQERKDVLEQTHSVSPDAHKATIEKFGKEIVDMLYNSAPNMYNLCSERVELVAGEIETRGKLYNDFESAIIFYQKEGIVEDSSPEIKEFNSIMEFLYLGRKSQKAGRFRVLLKQPKAAKW
ncbi:MULTISPECIES: hypothetical protein [unclassified Neglectibacter]|uniref:hypothetical protein n=1 Tax=unclassified Neglectibacter TaxID=2632164 RepID=UPI00136A7470|nr:MULTISPECIES: hypothetical protein [unclassified Neglectibacter]